MQMWMNVLLIEMTVQKMLTALTLMVASSAIANLASLEMVEFAEVCVCEGLLLYSRIAESHCRPVLF